ncbi:MAG: hypothetical protein GQ559_05390 [Desulfobulbaceae bacterium]|nr:hypothetical protein [Desulfobulbaceae bacterium]
MKCSMKNLAPAVILFLCIATDGFAASTGPGRDNVLKKGIPGVTQEMMLYEAAEAAAEDSYAEIIEKAPEENGSKAGVPDATSDKGEKNVAAPASSPSKP